MRDRTTIIVAGDAGVGKSSFIKRLDNLEQWRGNIGYSRCHEVENLDIRESVTPSKEFKELLKSNSAVILVFDVTKESSFDNLKKWMQHIPKNIPVALVANKTDLNAGRKVTAETAQTFAQSCDVTYYESSPHGQCAPIFTELAEKANKPRHVSELKENSTVRYYSDPVLEPATPEVNVFEVNKPTRGSRYIKGGLTATLLYGLAAGLVIGLLAVSPWILVVLAFPLAVMAYGRYQDKKQRRQSYLLNENVSFLPVGDSTRDITQDVSKGPQQQSVHEIPHSATQLYATVDGSNNTSPVVVPVPATNSLVV